MPSTAGAVLPSGALGGSVGFLPSAAGAVLPSGALGSSVGFLPSAAGAVLASTVLGGSVGFLASAAGAPFSLGSPTDKSDRDFILALILALSVSLSGRLSTTALMVCLPTFLAALTRRAPSMTSYCPSSSRRTLIGSLIPCFRTSSTSASKAGECSSSLKSGSILSLDSSTSLSISTTGFPAAFVSPCPAGDLGVGLVADDSRCLLSGI